MADRDVFLERVGSERERLQLAVLFGMSLGAAVEASDAFRWELKFLDELVSADQREARAVEIREQLNELAREEGMALGGLYRLLLDGVW